MSDYNWCLGSSCHTIRTFDRVRGVKGNKVLRTRKIQKTKWNENSYLGYFCSQRCLHDFLRTNLRQLIAIAPRPEPLETPIDVVQTKALGRKYDWDSREYVDYTYNEKRIVERT